MPCSVQLHGNGRDHITALGTAFSDTDAPTQSFYATFATWDGTWMWTGLHNEGHSIDWILTALHNGMGTLVVDGSFNHNLAPRISGAGWDFHCLASGLRVLGSGVVP